MIMNRRFRLVVYGFLVALEFFNIAINNTDTTGGRCLFAAGLVVFTACFVMTLVLPEAINEPPSKPFDQESE